MKNKSNNSVCFCLRNSQINSYQKTIKNVFRDDQEFFSLIKITTLYIYF